MGQIFDDVMNIFNGQTPIKRQNPRPGESAYYRVNPGQNLNTSTFTSLQTTDIQDNQPLFNTGQGLNQGQTGNGAPRYWETATDGEQAYNNVVKQEGNFTPPNQNIFSYTQSAIQGGMSLAGNFSEMSKMQVTDKYKHAYMNCAAAQYGQGGADIATLASNLREWNDVRTGSNTLDSSQGDQYANKIGRLLGGKYPKGDCDELVQRYIKKNW